MEITKNELKELILKFINQAKEQKSQSYKEYKKKFMDTDITVSFGKGAFADIPWIAFLGYSQKVQKGIYPVILFCKANNELNICYGISETNIPDKQWENIGDLAKFNCPGSKKYKESIVYEKVDVNDLNLDRIVESIEYLIIKYKKLFEKDKGNNMNKNISLNQILYGPPGTGKTYSVVEKAVEIIEGEKANSRDEAKEKFRKYKQNGQIEFITFHQSYSYEEFIEGLKPDLDSEEIKYKIEEGIFKSICERANQNYENSLKDNESLSKEEKFYKKLEILKDKIEEEIEKNGKFFLNETAYIYMIEDNAFRYTGDKWGNSQRMKFKDILQLYMNDIKSRQDIKKLDNISGLAKQHATYFFKLYSKLHSIQIGNITIQKEPLKNYILIIDEINRGNISKIFGELITLIEESKRIGNKEEMRVTLPYSKEEFGVPKNLYIIGTMNTSDRSIALMDTALRRRFEFVEMMPKAEILGKVVDKNNHDNDIYLEKMLIKINKRIEYLYDKDHTIGHSYFMGIKNIDELKDVFLNKIIPLLQEYFYDDLEKIDLVLNKNGFIVEEKIDNNLFKDYEIDEDKKVYKIEKNAFILENFKKIYE